MCVRMQIAQGQFKEAAALFKEALWDNPDDWTSLQQYLGCILHTSTKAGGEPGAARTTDSAELSNGMSHLGLQEQQQVVMQPKQCP